MDVMPYIVTGVVLWLIGLVLFIGILKYAIRRRFHELEQEKQVKERLGLNKDSKGEVTESQDNK